MSNAPVQHSPWAVMHSLRTLTLALFGVVLLTILTIIAVGVYSFVVATEQEAWQGRQAEAAKNACAAVTTFIQRANDYFNAVNNIFDDPHIDTLIAQLFPNYTSLEELIVLDANGNVLYSIARGEPILANLFTIPQSNWFAQARSGKYYLSPLQFSFQDKPHVIVAAPLSNGGVVAGQLAMDLLADVVAQVSFGRTGNAYLVNASGQILAHNDSRIRLADYNLANRPEMKAALMSTDAAWSGLYTNFEHEAVIGTATRVTGTDWLIFTEVEQSEAFATSQTALILLGSISTFLWLATMLVVALLLNRFIFRPLDALRAGAAQVEQGNLMHQVTLRRHDEIGALTVAFNTMVERLRERDEEVAARTDALTTEIAIRKQAQQELAHLVDELRIATDKALEVSRLKSEFLATMSHELRTPLNAIMGFSGLLIEGVAGELTPQTREMVQAIFSSSEHLHELINNILDLSKIEAGRMEIMVKPVYLRVLIGEWRTHFDVLAQRKGLSLIVTGHDDVPEIVLTDKVRLTQMVNNLVSNAIKFTEKGDVQLSLSWCDNVLTVTVRDTGIGIPLEALEYVFDEFRQVDGTYRRSYEGAGLGLAIVRRLCQLMQGQVSVSSVVGQGSLFTLTLPMPWTQITPTLDPIGAGLTGLN